MDEDVPGVALVAERDRHEVDARAALAVVHDDLLGAVGAAVRHDEDLERAARLGVEDAVEARGDVPLLVVREHHHGPGRAVQIRRLWFRDRSALVVGLP